MLDCYQMPGMNMLQHGQMVHEYFKDLYDHLSKGLPLTHEWKLSPTLLSHGAELIKSIDLNLAYDYQTYHDCGKPLCRTIDETGRQHFPNHAEHSYNAWIAAGGSEETGWYIKHDMNLHTLRSDELREFLKDPRIPLLLLTAWAEIHANCAMFGGVDTTSFKIKWKHLDKITRWYFEDLVHKNPKL